MAVAVVALLMVQAVPWAAGATQVGQGSWAALGGGTGVIGVWSGAVPLAVPESSAVAQVALRLRCESRDPGDPLRWVRVALYTGSTLVAGADRTCQTIERWDGSYGSELLTLRADGLEAGRPVTLRVDSSGLSWAVGAGTITFWADLAGGGGAGTVYQWSLPEGWCWSDGSSGTGPDDVPESGLWVGPYPVAVPCDAVVYGPADVDLGWSWSAVWNGPGGPWSLESTGVVPGASEEWHVKVEWAFTSGRAWSDNLAKAIRLRLWNQAGSAVADIGAWGGGLLATDGYSWSYHLWGPAGTGGYQANQVPASGVWEGDVPRPAWGAGASSDRFWAGFQPGIYTSESASGTVRVRVWFEGPAGAEEPQDPCVWQAPGKRPVVVSAALAAAADIGACSPTTGNPWPGELVPPSSWAGEACTAPDGFDIGQLLSWVGCGVASLPGLVASAIGGFLQWLFVPDWGRVTERLQWTFSNVSGGTLLGQVFDALEGFEAVGLQGLPVVSGQWSLGVGSSSVAVSAAGALEWVSGQLAPWRSVLAGWIWALTAVSVAALAARWFGFRGPFGGGGE